MPTLDLLSIRIPEAHQKSAIFITGSVNAVKLTHAYLQGQLPLTLLFELSEEATAVLQQAVEGGDE